MRPSQIASQLLATALEHLGQRDEAIQVLQRGISFHPRAAELHRTLARLLSSGNEPRLAEQALANTIALDPRDWRSRIALAKIFMGRTARDAAATLASEALTILGPVRASDNDMLTGWDDITTILYRSGKMDLAAEVCKGTYALAPSPARALATNMIAREVCDWEFAAELEPVARQLFDRPDGIEAGSPWLLLALQSLTAKEQLQATRSFVAATCGRAQPLAPAAVTARERIRVGYFSADFYNHPTSVLLAGVIENHDRNRFELIACDLSPPHRDHYRTRLEAAFDKFLLLRDLPDAAASAAIASEKIDIIIDLNGWTLGGRPEILAPRPAAIQMQWLGYPGTLAAPWIDYIIADATVIPPGHDDCYSEKVIRLPETYQPNDRPKPAEGKATRGEHGLPEGALVLCCFNQIFKITADVFALWMRILKRTPSAVLWLLASSDGAMTRLRAEAERQGIAPDRLIFAPKVQLDAHIARLSLADLALDCLPYGSHTTASDAIHAGVPILALQGDIFAARVSASIVKAAGCPELMASSLHEYEEMACGLLGNSEKLSALRAKIASARQSSILFDPARFSRQLEQALFAAFDRARSGLAPEAIYLREPS